MNRDASVTVHAPYGVSKAVIDEFVNKNAQRIGEIQRLRLEKEQKLQAQDEEALRCLAKEYIPQRVCYYARVMGVTPTGVKITSAKSRFGSCNGKNSLCFSLYLMTYPKEAVDAVIVHELAHITEKNHSQRFYDIVYKYMPDYKKREAILKNGIL